MSFSHPRKNRQRKTYLLDRSQPRPVTNSTISTAAVGSGPTKVIVTFSSPVLYPTTGLPANFSRGAITATTVDAKSSTGITLTMSGNVTAGQSWSFSNLDEAWRSTNGGYVLPSAGSL